MWARLGVGLPHAVIACHRSRKKRERGAGEYPGSRLSVSPENKWLQASSGAQEAQTLGFWVVALLGGGLAFRSRSTVADTITAYPLTNRAMF